MKVWVATYTYGNDTTVIIGVFSTETKAIQACEDIYSKNYNNGKPLNWINGTAIFNSWSYDVTAREVDKPVE